MFFFSLGWRGSKAGSRDNKNKTMGKEVEQLAATSHVSSQTHNLPSKAQTLSDATIPPLSPGHVTSGDPELHSHWGFCSTDNPLVPVAAHDRPAESLLENRSKNPDGTTGPL